METEIYKNLSLEDLPNEEWRDVVGYEGIYMVSNLGRVKSLDRQVLNHGTTILKKSKIISQFDNGHGYKTVQLNFNNKSKKEYVHRLVYKSFCGEIPIGFEINHISKCKHQNNVENLEILTRKGNMEYSKDDIFDAKHKPCYLYNKDGFFVKEYLSIKEAAEDNNISPSAVVNSCTRFNKYGSEKHFRYFKVDKIEIPKRKYKKILMFSCDNKEVIREFDSAKEASEFLGCNTNNIVCACLGKIKTCKGFIFKYKNKQLWQQKTN